MKQVAKLLGEVDLATIGLVVLGIYILAQLGFLATRDDVHHIHEEMSDRLGRIEGTLDAMRYWNPSLSDSIPEGPTP